MVEAEAKIIRDIAQQVLDGASLRSVTADLAASGVTGRNGKPFTIPSVRKILLRADDRGVPGGGPACSSRSKEWEPILDRETWNKLRSGCSTPARRNLHRQHRQWLLGHRHLRPLRRGGEPVKMAAKPHKRAPLLLPDLRPLHRGRPHRRGRRADVLAMLDPVTWRRLRRGRTAADEDSSGFEEAMATVTARFVAGDIDAVELGELAEGLRRQQQAVATPPPSLPDVPDLGKAWAICSTLETAPPGDRGGHRVAGDPTVDARRQPLRRVAHRLDARRMTVL